MSETDPAKIREAVKQQLREDADLPLGKLREKIGCSMSELIDVLDDMQREDDWV